jgi:midasin (ATPase involved in ribosome maturation)
MAKRLEVGLSHLCSQGVLTGSVRTGTLTGLSVLLSRWGEGAISQLPHIIAQRRMTTSGLDRDLLLLLDPVGRSEWNPARFHFDPRPTEAVRATGALTRLFRRARDILREFPGNEVLTQICVLTARVAEVEASAPLGKLLSSLQILLFKAQEWNQYSARHVSLEAEMVELGHLIAGWRQIELKSWADLLRAKEVQFAQRAMQHWFSLFEIVRSQEAHVPNGSFNGPLKWNTVPNKSSSCSWLVQALRVQLQYYCGPDQTSFLKSVVDAIDGFLRHAVVGEFPTRLHLVRLFAVQLHQEVITHALKDKMTSLYSQLVNVITGIWQYYDQFLPEVRAFQSNLRSLIDDKVGGVAKISKWDTLNTYSLLAHSEKTHRNLHRLVKEYQTDVLEYPLSALLRKSLVGNLASDQGELIPVTEVPSSKDLFPIICIEEHVEDSSFEEMMESDAIAMSRNHLDLANLANLVDLPVRLQDSHRLFTKLSSYLGKLLSSNGQETCTLRYWLEVSRDSEEYVGEAFRRITELRAEETSKAIKYRAVHDMFTLLRDEGFSHLRSDVPEELRSLQDLLITPMPLPVETLCRLDATRAETLERGEMYYMRNLSELNQLQAQAISPISKDMSSRDVQLMVGLAENMTWTAVQTRCVLVAGVEEHKQAVTTLMKLEGLLSLDTESALSSAESEAVTSIEHLVALSSEAGGYLVEAGSVVLDGLLQLRLLLDTAAQAQRPEHFEPHTCLPTYSALDLRAADDTLLASTQGLEAALQLGTPSSEGTDHTLLGFVFKTLPSPLTSIQWLSVLGLVHGVVTTLVQRHTLLASLLTSDAVDPVVDKLNTFAMRLGAYAESIRAARQECVLECGSQEVDGTVAAVVSSIELCLVIVQNLRKETADGEVKTAGDDETMADGENIAAGGESRTTLAAGLTRGSRVLQALQLPSLTASIATLSAQVAATTSKTSFAAARQALPFLRAVLLAHRTNVVDLCNAHKSGGKLLYICLRIFRTLLAKGICSADANEEEGGEGTGDMTFEDNVEGTGMGEGDGLKDVSDQIQNEDQLAGLKDDEKKESGDDKDKEKPLTEEERDTGVEMQQEFDGDMHELPRKNIYNSHLTIP